MHAPGTGTRTSIVERMLHGWRAWTLAGIVLPSPTIDAQSGRGKMSGYMVLKGAAASTSARAHIELSGTHPQERLKYQGDTDERGTTAGSPRIAR